MEERESLAVGGRGDAGALVRRIVLWLQEEVRRAGAQGLVLGLSGGVDSAVVAALALRACSPERVLGLILPCESQPQDEADARLVAEALKLKTARVDLTPGLKALTGVLPEAPALVRANLKARLRMLTLYHFAGRHGYLVAGTGNRTELELGYFTKYGDGGCDLLPLGALLKREVRELASRLGVPKKIIEKPPTAGLWAGQTDEGELGASYAELDRAVEVRGTARERAAPPGAAKILLARHAASEHKRRLPPICPR